jgi:hypothetical protein
VTIRVRNCLMSLFQINRHILRGPLAANFTCANLDRYRVRFGIFFRLWTLNLFDARRAKAHFESRQQSTCRPDSPSSNLSASTADSDGVRNVRRRDRWLPPLDQTFAKGVAAASFALIPFPMSVRWTIAPQTLAFNHPCRSPPIKEKLQCISNVSFLHPVWC